MSNYLIVSLTLCLSAMHAFLHPIFVISMAFAIIASGHFTEFTKFSTDLCKIFSTFFFLLIFGLFSQISQLCGLLFCDFLRDPL